MIDIKYWLAVALLVAPWLIGASPGPVDQLGAWLATCTVLAVLLLSQSVRFWRESLIVAAVISWCMALIQFSGFDAGLAPWVTESAGGEMVANLRQRNLFSTLMVIGALALWFGRSRSSLGLNIIKPPGAQEYFKSRWLQYTGRSVLIVVFAFASALSGSRTGLLQWLALLALAMSWRQIWATNMSWVSCSGMIGYGTGTLFGPLLAQMAGHTNVGLLGRVPASDEQSRLALWSNILELVAREPFLGHGWRSLAYMHYSTEFSGPRFMELLDNAHNLPLHLAVELGLPVALAFCGLVIWLIWKNKPWAETRADRQLAWGMLMVIGIHSMVEYPLWYGPFFMTALLAVGILCADVWRDWLLGQTQRARAAIVLGVRGFAVLLLAGTAFAAFDYHRVSQIYLQPDERSPWYEADALGAAQKSTLFQSHAKFAELVITPLSRETAPRVLQLSSEMVQWSPEPRVIEKLIESAVMMEAYDIALFHWRRYREAYPQAYANWKANNQKLSDLSRRL
jgi:O-antigen ligase